MVAPVPDENAEVIGTVAFILDAGTWAGMGILSFVFAYSACSIGLIDF